MSRDRFADFSMAYTYGDIKQTLLITEVKPPKKCRNGHRPDLYKLGNEMKDTMDKIIKDGIHNEKIVCIGLLVEGMVMRIGRKVESGAVLTKYK